MFYQRMLVNLLPTTKQDKSYINKAMRCGLTLTAFDIDTLIDKSDRTFSAGYSARSQSAPSSPS